MKSGVGRGGERRKMRSRSIRCLELDGRKFKSCHREQCNLSGKLMFSGVFDSEEANRAFALGTTWDSAEV